MSIVASKQLLSYGSSLMSRSGTYLLKGLARTLLARLGYEVSRLSTRTPSDSPSAFHVALMALMSVRRRLRVVQVGANDGYFNDPLYPALSKYPDRTDILLIEPQKDLIPYLIETYRFHPSAIIHNGAIGAQGELTLYRVKKEYWSSLQVPYATGWPEYRAPTGVTSSNRQHVETWLSGIGTPSNAIPSMIGKEQAQCAPLLQVLEAYGWTGEIDVLQIDAEGFDDVVIYQSSIDVIRPSVINFEWPPMGKEKFHALKIYLQDSGYSLSLHGNDGLAIRVQA